MIFYLFDDSSCPSNLYFILGNRYWDMTMYFCSLRFCNNPVELMETILEITADANIKQENFVKVNFMV